MAVPNPAAIVAVGEQRGTAEPADVLAFFGATGDLAHKKIFPAMQHMIRRGTHGGPVIGVAKSGWTIDQLRARARDSLIQHGGGVDKEVMENLLFFRFANTSLEPI
jgi:glucose-6-phosphate 1-dehydrogenase